MGSPDQERDEHGRWTSGGGSSLAKWASKNHDVGRLAAPLVGSILKNGGFTYRPTADPKQRTPKDGFSVSLAPGEGHGHILEVGEMAKKMPPPSEKELRASFVSQMKTWIEREVPKLDKLPAGYHLGGWAQRDPPDTGPVVAIHLDISERFAPEQKEAAIKAGRERNQLAIFDLKSHEEISTGGTGRL